MTAGRLLGIARHGRKFGPMETVEQVAVSVAAGIAGDYRGALKPGRNLRQVTVMAVEGWQDALRELAVAVPWQERRVNLLVEGLELAETAGATLRFAGGVALLVTGECWPCERMDALAPGLRAALTPRWRGGVTARVIEGGALALGDEVGFAG